MTTFAPLIRSLRTAIARKPAPAKVRRKPEAHALPRHKRIAPKPMIQAKFSISEPGDAFEQEADLVADEVMHVPDAALGSAPVESPSSGRAAAARSSASAGPTVQRACSECAKDEEDDGKMVQRAGDGSPARPAPAFSQRLGRARAAGGTPLPDGVRQFMEPRFGQNFDSVRIHTDARAGELSRGIGARAFTTGPDIFFRPSEFRPSALEGRRLIAHELAHVVQQDAGRGRIQRDVIQRLETNDEGAGAEKGTPIAVAKASVGASERGLRVAPMGSVLYEAGPKLGQVVAFVIKNLVVSGFRAGMEVEALAEVPGLDITPDLGGDAMAGETVRAVTVRSGTAAALMTWLQDEKGLKLVVSESDQDVLRFANESVSLLVKLVEQKRFKLPQWMSNDLFREILVRRTSLSVMRQFLDASQRFRQKKGDAKEVATLFKTAIEPLNFDTSVADTISHDVALSDLPEFVMLFETLSDRSALSDFFAFLEQEHAGDDDPLKRAALGNSSAREELLVRFGRFQRGESLEEGGGAGTGAGKGAGEAGAGTGGGGFAEDWLLNKGVQGVLEGKKPPLRGGSRGDDVKLVQQVLRRWGEKGATPPRDLLPKGGADGDFGPETDKAVREFQDENGLKSDGVVGPETLRALDEFALADGEVSREGMVILPPIPATLTTTPELGAPPLFSFGAELQAQMVFQFADVFDAFSKFGFKWNRVRVPEKAGIFDAETAPGESISFSEVAKARLARQKKNAEADLKTVTDQLGPANSTAFGLVAAKTIVSFVGTGVGIAIDEITRPRSEHAIQFPTPGFYLVRCVAQQIPPEGAKFTHAASVAYVPVFVRHQEEIATEHVQAVDAILTRIGELEKLLEKNPADRAKLEFELRDLKLKIGDPKTHLEEIEKLLKDGDSLSDAEKRVLEERRDHFKQLLELQKERAAEGATDTERLATTFVNDDGQEFVLSLEASRLPSDGDTVRYFVNDFTTPNSSQETGETKTTGNAKNDKATAILAAVRAILSGISGYGRGTVAIVIDGVRHTLRIEASLGTIILEGLEAATTVAQIAAIVAAPFTGGGSLVLMMPIGAVGAIPSGYRLIHRGIDGTLRLDFQSALDVANLIGGLAGLGQPAAASLRMVRLRNAFMFVGLRADGAGILLMQADLVHQLASVEGTPGQKRAKILKILAGAMLNVGISVGTMLGRRGDVEARAAETETRITDGGEEPRRPGGEVEPPGPRPGPEPKPGEPGTRKLAGGGTLTTTPDGRRILCMSPCVELQHLGVSDAVLEAGVNNLRVEDVPKKELIDTLAAFKGSADIPVVERIVQDLAAGGQADAVSDFVSRLARIRTEVKIDLPSLHAAFVRGDAILHHPTPQDPIFLGEARSAEDKRESRPGEPSLSNGRFSMGDHARTASVLREFRGVIDFVIIVENGRQRVILGMSHFGLSGDRAFVFGAGELVISDADKDFGIVISVTANSGHYRPSPANRERAIQFLRDHGMLGLRGIGETRER